MGKKFNESKASKVWAELISWAYTEKEGSLKKLADAFLKKIGVDPQKVAYVKTEVSMSKGRKNRADIVIYGSDNKELAIIENKLYGSPNVGDVIDQVNRYARHAKGSDCKKVIMTWSYEASDQWKDMSSKEKNNITFLALDDQIDLLEKYKVNNDNVRDYLIYAKEAKKSSDANIDDVKQRVERHLSKNPLSSLEKMSFPDPQTAQQLVLKIMTEGVRESWNYDRHKRNPSTFWTNAYFHINGHVFFYRINGNKDEYYDFILYYHKPESSLTVNALREWCKDNPLQVPNVRLGYQKAGEPRLWGVRFKDLTMDAEAFNSELHKWHENFRAAAEKIIKDLARPPNQRERATPQHDA